MKSERVEFKGHSGDMLAARLDLPDGPVRAAAVFAHCFTCSKDIAAARRIAGRLTGFGIAVLRFDFTGLGHSGGEFANTHFSSNVADLLAAVQFMAERNMPVQLLVGHSLGGAAVLKAAVDVPSLKAVATIAAPAEPEHVTHNFGGKLAEIRENGHAKVNLGGRSFEIRKEFIDDVSAASLDNAIPRLKAALLVMHAPGDDTVGVDNATRIFVAAKHPKSFVSLDNADHLVTREEDAEYIAELIATWSSRYLELASEPKIPDVPEGFVRVAEDHSDGFLQNILANGTHQLLADEPKSIGGTNLGPTPYQYLCAGLGACTSMTIRLYARRKKIALTHVACDVSHGRSHGEDCAECEESGAKIDVFYRIIRLEGDLTEDERASLLVIADKCPVHKTLEARAVVKTELFKE